MTMEHESNGDTNCNRRPRFSDQRIGRWTGELGNKRTNGYQPNDNIIKIGPNTENSPEDLRKIAVTQTPVRNPQLTLVGKIRKE